MPPKKTSNSKDSKSIWRYVSTLIQNSTFQFFISILLTLTIFILQRNEVNFSYFAETESYIPTKATRANSKMRVFLEEQEVQDIKSRKLVFANLGSKHIDYQDLVDGRLISIPIPSECRILDATILRQSRPELSFKLDFEVSKKTNNLTLFLKNNEAIEEKDGVQLNLIYTGNQSCDLKPVARIKGKSEPLNQLSTNIFAGII